MLVADISPMQFHLDGPSRALTICIGGWIPSLGQRLSSPEQLDRLAQSLMAVASRWRSELHESSESDV